IAVGGCVRGIRGSDGRDRHRHRRAIPPRDPGGWRDAAGTAILRGFPRSRTGAGGVAEELRAGGLNPDHLQAAALAAEHAAEVAALVAARVDAVIAATIAAFTAAASACATALATASAPALPASSSSAMRFLSVVCCDLG